MSAKNQARFYAAWDAKKRTTHTRFSLRVPLDLDERIVRSAKRDGVSKANAILRACSTAFPSKEPSLTVTVVQNDEGVSA